MEGIKNQAQVSRQKRKTVVIAGGGTGGHIYPAVAIARALQKKDSQIEIHFVGARGGLEERIIPREKFPLHLLRIGKLHHSVGIFTRLITLLLLPLALLQAVALLIKLKPSLVVGVGGYASGPFLLLASLFRVPTALWEPNAYPGLANRLLASRVDKCLVVFDEARKHMHGKKFVKVGLPVRSEITDQRVERPDGMPSFHLLVFGGSQGARHINQVVARAVAEGGDWLKGVKIVHQTGSLDFDAINTGYLGKSPQIQAFEFLHDMERRYAWADLVLCRAGASTVAEICAARKATVFVPLPTAADNHQQKNAEVLQRAQAADMVLQKDFTASYLINLLLKYKKNPELLAKMEENLRVFQSPRAAERTAEELLNP